MSIKGKVAVITGASSGVGLGAATVFARGGAQVIATARRTELGAELEAKARAEGGELTFVRTDVQSKADCELAVQAAIDHYGRIDILINNAGIEGELAPFHLTTDEDWRAVMSTNLDSAFYTIRAAIPHMLEQGGGVIMNIASINGDNLPVGLMSPYNTSKAALIQLTKSVAIEYVLQNIRANAIVLGGVHGDTGSRTQAKIAKFIRGDDFERTTEMSDMEKSVIMTAEDVGECMATLCSDGAALLTGAAIPIDRGMTAGWTNSIMVQMMSAQLWTAAGELHPT